MVKNLICNQDLDLERYCLDWMLIAILMHHWNKVSLSLVPQKNAGLKYCWKQVSDQTCYPHYCRHVFYITLCIVPQHNFLLLIVRKLQWMEIFHTMVLLLKSSHFPTHPFWQAAGAGLLCLLLSTRHPLSTQISMPRVLRVIHLAWPGEGFVCL